MHIAVTGATGFLGRCVVRHLAAAGHCLRCWHRPNSDRSGLEPWVDGIEWLPGTLGEATMAPPGEHRGQPPPYERTPGRLKALRGKARDAAKDFHPASTAAFKGLSGSVLAPKPLDVAKLVDILGHLTES